MRKCVSNLHILFNGYFFTYLGLCAVKCDIATLRFFSLIAYSHKSG